MSTSVRPNNVRTNRVNNGLCANLRPVPRPPYKAPLHIVGAEGQLQVHSTPYRGSFSVVLSEALRAAGLGRRVMVVQFLKGGVNQGPKGSVKLCGRLEWLRPSVYGCLAKAPEQETNEAAQSNSSEAVLEIWNICKKRLIEGELDQLVLDEIGLAISLGYLQESDVLATLEQRPGAMDIILTGPAIPTCIMDMADQITELRCGC